MPQITTVYNGNYVVWQRKLAESVIDLKTDVNNIRKLGLTIAESAMFNFTASHGIYVSLEVASNGAPNTWSLIHGALLSDNSWVADAGNLVPPNTGEWVENTYSFTNNVDISGRYLRFRIANDVSYTPLQTVALKKVLIKDNIDNSLLGGASAQVNVLGWQTGKVLKDILEDLLEENILLTTIKEEVTNARNSPKGTWDNTSENYIAPIPKIFASLKSRLDDLEQDAERRLISRKVIIPAQDAVTILPTNPVVETHIRADAPYRKIKQYVAASDTVDVLVQGTEGVGVYEYPLRDPSGALIIGKVTYGCDSVGYVAGTNAKITLARADNGNLFSLISNRTCQIIVPIETDLFHMDKTDLTRNQFSTAVIQDIGIINDIETIKAEIAAVLTSDSVSHDLVVYDSGGMFYADLVFDSNAIAAIGWQVLKNGLPATPNGDYTFTDSRKIRLNTHDNLTPSKWSIAYFTKPQSDLDHKINEIIEAIARLATAINVVVSNIDEINDALMPHAHTESLQFDYAFNDGFDYFKSLTYKARDIDNGAAVIYKNGISIGAKDTVWAFKADGIVAMHRASQTYDRNAQYSIRYYFQRYTHLVNKLQDMTNTSDRDLIVTNWTITNPVPPEADSDGVKLI